MLKAYAIGIDIGGTNLRVALVGRDGNVVRKLVEPTTGDIMQTLRKTVEALEGPDVAGIGIGVAGFIDRGSKKVITSPNIPSIDGKGFEEISSLPVFVENDANAAAFGELWTGAGREFGDFVLMTLGTGIGGGFVHKGRLLKVLAEVGHMSIKFDGKGCPCGNRGCLELYCSARAIMESVTKALEEGAESILRESSKGSIYKITPEDIFKAAFEGDNLALKTLKEAGTYLGVGIANIINMMSPEAVILAGGLTGAWEIYVEEAKKEASKRAFKGLFEKVRIIPSSLGGDAGIVGAAGIAFRMGEAGI
jgi:glucokinase